MIKVLQITGFRKGKDKFENEQYVIDGLDMAVQQNYHGWPMKRTYVRCDRIKELSDDDIQKALYVEYNERGTIIKTEVK